MSALSLYLCAYMFLFDLKSLYKSGIKKSNSLLKNKRLEKNVFF